MRRGQLFIYSGPSGVGKGTLMGPLLQKGLARFSVSATTRAPRQGETDGVDYFFISRERFEQMIAAGELLEHAQYSGNYYGTPRRAVEEMLERGENVVLEIEVQGAMQVHRLCPEAVMIFVMPPSLDSLRERLCGRGTEDEKTVTKRLAAAAAEIRTAAEYDYILVNDDVESARKILEGILQSGSALGRLRQNTIKEVLSRC